jgi:DNA-binding IclR family transcriptional regulator
VRPAERNTPAVSGEPTSVVRRIALLMTAFGPQDTYLGVNELARRTDLPKATVSRLVKEMVEHGFLERSGGRVGLGLSLFEWGEQASRRRSVREVALPFMADLREATGQTIHLAILDGSEVVYIEILRHHNAPKLPSKVGGRFPAHATGVGKALLAASPETVVERTIEAGLVPIGPRTITSEQQLRRQLKRIAAAGLAYDYEESVLGIVCVASAICDSQGAPIAAVSVSGWAGKVDIRRVAPAVHTTALSIARSFLNSPPA